MSTWVEARGVFTDDGGRQAKVTCKNLDALVRGADPYMAAGVATARAILKARKRVVVQDLPAEWANRTNRVAWRMWAQDFAFAFERGRGAGESHGAYEIMLACPRVVEKARKLGV